MQNFQLLSPGYSFFVAASPKQPKSYFIDQTEDLMEVELPMNYTSFCMPLLLTVKYFQPNV